MKVHCSKGVNTGIQKTIFDKRGTIHVNFNDVFSTMYWYGTSNFAGQYLNARVYWEPRRVVIGFGYKFGKSKVKSAEQRKSGQDDESSRTNDNSSGN
ncbi:MAG TPA: outer membrane beta-barrel protein [Ferruginibacter sp.]|nr:outer membrane beta-barrel protein [Ferruginibacter sp.]